MAERVYRVEAADHCQSCHPVVSEDTMIIGETLRGHALGGDWNPIEVRVVEYCDDRLLAYSDLPWFRSDAWFVRSSALVDIGSLLVENGELLPVKCESADLVLFNSTHVVDVVDQDRSTILRFPDGRPYFVREFIFNETVHKVPAVFKIDLMRVNPILVSDVFVDTWRAAGLKGLEFKCVWQARNS